SGTLVGWTPLDTPSLDLITRARFRLWTNASVTTRPAGSISVVCAGLRGSPAPIAERQGSPPPWVMAGGWLYTRPRNREQGHRRHSSREERPGAWPHPPSADRRCLDRQPASLRPRRCGARGDGSHRRLEGLCRTGGGRLPASGHGPQRRLRPGARSHAARPPRRLAAQATADRYSPGWRPASTSRLLPRRIHLPLQSPQIKGPLAALSSPLPTSPRRWTRALQRHRQATGFQRIPDNGAMKGIPSLEKYAYV